MTAVLASSVAVGGSDPVSGASEFAAIIANSWDTGTTSEAARCVNTERPLTHHSLTTRRQAAVKATHPSCGPWTGDAASYQEMAGRILIDAEQRTSVLPWTWYSAQCGTPNCVTYGHFTAASPVRIQYPSMVCIYCGRPGGTKDHLLPKGMTGETQRRFVATVPACSECNTLLSDVIVWQVGARREEAHKRLRHRHRRVLAPVADYRELEGNLRQYVRASHKKFEFVQALLAWPDDPFYDLRAFQKSGIEDPYALGLI